MAGKNLSKKTKLLFWVLTICLLLSTGAAILTNVILSKRLKAQLQSYTSPSIGKQYTLTITNLHFNLFSRHLTIDSLQIETGENRGQHMTFNAPEISAKGISLLKLLLFRELKINKLDITNPTLEVYGQSQENDGKEIKTEFGEKINLLFEQILKNISIRRINMNNARLNHFKFSGSLTPFGPANKLNIEVSDFYADRNTLKKTELFEAGEIYLKIKNLERSLGDSLHHVYMDELTYSVKNKKIQAVNIRMFPEDTTNTRKTCYWVTVPEIELSSDDLRHFPGNDTIMIKSLNLRHCRIRIRPPVNSSEFSFRKLHDFDLYQLFKNEFKLIRIGHLSFEGTKMHIDSRCNDPDIYQEFNNIKVDLNNFTLDSSACTQPDKILYSDGFNLSVGSYLLRFNDKVHQFNAENIYASSTDSLIQSGRIKLFPVAKDKRIPTTVDLSCDSVRLLSVNFHRLFHFREMPLNEIAAFRPVVTINQFHKPKEKDSESLLYQFIGNYIKGIYAHVVALEHGHFEINDFQNRKDPGKIQSDISFRLTDFSLDSVTAKKSDKLFYATNIDLSFRNYRMKLADQLHRLEVEQINVSSIQRLVTIKNLHLFPDKRVNVQEMMERLNRTELYEIRIPLLQLSNANINYAFFRKELLIKNISITNPDIYFELFANKKREEKEFSPDEFYELLNNYITHIEIGQINATDGQFRLVNHGKKGKVIDLTNKFSLKLEHFVLDDAELKKKRLLFSDSFDLKLKDHLFKLSDNVHFLKANEIDLSSKNSSVSIEGALLYPDITSPGYKNLPWHLQISIPMIRLDQVDLNQAYFDEILRVGVLSVKSPVIEIYQNKKKETKRVNFKDITIPLPGELKELVVEKASIDEGQLKIYNVSQMQQKMVASANIAFSMKQARLKRTGNNSTAKFASDDIDAIITDLNLSPEEVPYKVNIQKINFSSGKKLLDMKGLDIRLTNSREKKAIASIQMPELKFEGLDPINAFQNNLFHADVIHATKPIFTINYIENKTRANPLLIKLPQDILPVIDVLSAEKVTVDDAGFLFKKDSTTKDQHHINISLDKFRLDSTLSSDPLGASNLLVYKDNNTFTDKNRYYNIGIRRISFSSNNNQLSFEGINISPRYSRADFQKKIKWQTDYYTGDIEDIDLTGIDLARWFSEHELAGNSLIVNNARIDIFRDKRTPFNEKRRIAMPQKEIKNFDLPFMFDSVKINNASVSYSEQLENMPGPGIVWFDQINCKLHPFTNLPGYLKEHPNALLSATARFMDAGTLNVNMNFDMASPSCEFEAEGSLSPFDLTAINPITGNNAQILVRSGQLNQFDFNFRADSVNSEGELMFAYDNLKISILEQKNGDTKEARFLSFLANSLMLKSKNPRTKILLPDEIYFVRDPRKSIINYWWKTVFSGAKNTFGIREEKD